jgi:hypothetical protein
MSVLPPFRRDAAARNKHAALRDERYWHSAACQRYALLRSLLQVWVCDCPLCSSLDVGSVPGI